MSDYIMMFTLPGRLTLYRETVRTLEENQIPSAFHVRRLNRMISTQETFIMPSKVQKTGKKGNGFTTTFVNYKLAGKERDEFAEFFAEAIEAHSKALIENMAAGVKFSFSENRDQGFYLASATMRDEGNVNFDRCVTSRSPDWYEALLMCVFKIRVLGLGEDWLDQAEDENWG